MPTAVPINETLESEDGNDSGGDWSSECETAGTSGMRWVAEHLTCRRRASLECRVNNTSTGSDAESILDATMTTTTMARRQEQPFIESHGGTESTIPHQACLTNHHQSFNEDDLLVCTQQPTSLTPPNRSRRYDSTERTTSQRHDSLNSQGEANLEVRCSQSFNDHSLSKTMNDDDIALHLSNNPQPHEHSSERMEPLISSPTPPPPPPPTVLSKQRSHSRHDTGTSRPARNMGPNETLYTEQYGPLVSKYIQAFQLRYPGQLRNYRSMNDDAKRREQTHIVQLLQRLRANKENMVLSVDTGGDDDCNDDAIARLRSNHQRVEVHENSTLSSNDSACETSLALLSPVPSESTNTRSQILFSPVANEPDVSDTSMVLSPVQQNATASRDAYTAQSVGGGSLKEGTVGCGYESPETVRRESKRLASTSGKRGADLVRARLLENADEFSMDEYKHSTSPSKELVNSIGRLSLVDESIFTSSQSPIVPRMTHSPIQNEYSPNDFAAPDISFAVDHDESDLSCQLLENDSLIETAMLPEKRVRWDFEGQLTKEAPTDVRLLNGRVPQWPKLPMERLKSATVPTQSFPDPLSLYPEKTQRRLTRLYRWMHQLDHSRSNEVGCAVFLSLSTQTIVDLILKLQLDTVPAGKDQSLEKNSPLTGNTLIVARSKKDLEVWGRSYREGSVCSVFNHASLAMTQRKSLSTSEYAVQFDVVLTTFDALKSPDVTLTLDQSGFVIHKNTGLRQGWYTSASQHTTESAVKRQFSALHRVNWNRIVFLDVLGRKSYLAKAETARVQASRAINSTTRLVFFVPAENEASGVDMLMKSDRTVCQSLSSVLRLEESGSDEEVLRSRIIDFQDKSTHLAMKVN